MNLSTTYTKQDKLAAQKDLIARLDRAVELATSLKAQAQAMEVCLKEHHTSEFA